MDEDEYVETSDVEEREETVWQTQKEPEMLPKQARDADENDTPFLDDNGPPRKRIKLESTSPNGAGERSRIVSATESRTPVEDSSTTIHSDKMDIEEDIFWGGPSLLDSPVSTRASPDPLLLAGQLDPPPLSPLSRGEDMDGTSGYASTPPQQLSDLPPSTSRSPTRSPTFTHTSRSQSADPLSIFGPSSPTLAARSSQQPIGGQKSPTSLKSLNNDLSLSPDRPALRLVTNSPEERSSPALPISASSPGPSTNLDSSFSSPSSPLQFLSHPHEPDEPAIQSPGQGHVNHSDVIIPPDTEPPGGRYSLRQRAPHQEKPYTVENYQYKQLLKHNREAIVKLPRHTSPRRAQSRSERPEEDGDFGEDSQWQQDDPHPDSSPAGGSRVNQIELHGLPGLDESDEEDSAEMRGTRKEARRLKRMDRERERQKQAEKENAHPHQPRKFPLAKKRIRTRSPSDHESPRRAQSAGPSYYEEFYRYDEDPPEPAVLDHPAPSPPAPAAPPSVDDDDESDKDPAPAAAEPASLANLNHKQAKALNRMMPRFMAQKLVQEGQRKSNSRRQSSNAPESDSDEQESAPLLPGQSRKTMGKQRRERWEIKGDSETSSSEDEPESEQGVIEINSDSDCVDHDETQHFLDEEEADEEEVEFVGSRQPTFKRVREAPLIDWMLSGQRKIGAKKKPRGTRRPTDRSRRTTGMARSNSSYKLDILTSGARREGRETQTLLGFQPLERGSTPASSHDRHHSSSKGKKRKNYEGYSDHDGYGLSDAENQASSSRRERRIPPDPTSTSLYLLTGQGPKEARKAKEKRKRATAKARGHYFFPTDDSRLESRKRDGVVTIDLENTEVLAALKPAEDNWATYLPPPPKVKKKPTRATPSGDAGFSHQPSDRRPAPINVDSDVEEVTTSTTNTGKKNVWGKFHLVPLTSGFTFKSGTLIKKQCLDNLLNTLSNATTPSMPVEVTRQGVTLDPTKGLTHLRQVIVKIANGFFELATGLPSTDAEQDHTDWQTLQRAALQMISVLLIQGNSSEVVTSLEEEVKMQVARGKKSEMISKDMEVAAFSYMWFAVEVCARLKLPHPSTTLKEAISFLVHGLVGYGVRQTMRCINPDRKLEVDGLPANEWTAELWVNLYYLVNQWPEASDESQMHPFWSLVQTELQLMPHQNHVRASETIWHTIISLCILTQFSKHGMVTKDTHGASCWELVVLAERRIRLDLSEKDASYSRQTLDQRDGYITLHLLRCFYLSEKWNWPIKDAIRTDLFAIFQTLFRSRGFAKLRGEKEEYPSFMVKGDWSLLLKHQPDDTAFCMYIKLLVQLARSFHGNPDKRSQNKLKKLLSGATPISLLPYSKQSDARVDLSMYTNRLTVILALVYLDPTQAKDRIVQAREYVNFEHVNHSVRNTVIRAVMMLGQLLVEQESSREPLASWIETIADALVRNHKALKGNPSAAKELSTVHTMTFALVLAVGGILETMGKALIYPSPVFITSLLCILSNQGLTDSLGPANCIRHFLIKLMNARKLVVPEPQRPPIASETQESQDEYGDMDWGLDFNDVPFESLDGPNKFAEQEKELAQAIEKSRMQWTCWRQVARLIREGKEHLADCTGGSFDSWMECWLWCADILDRHRSGKESGHTRLFKLLEDNSTKGLPPLRRQRIEIRLMSKLLKLNPMTYLDFKDRYLEGLIVCLASINTHPDLEREYVDFLLEIDGCRHPLLLGCQRDGDNQELFGRSTAEYLKLRHNVLEAIFRNLADLLNGEAMTDDLQTHEDNKKYVGFLIIMFRAMEDRVKELSKESDERRAYVGRCTDVFQMLHKHQVLRSHSRLTYWVDWERSLHDD